MGNENNTINPGYFGPGVLGKEIYEKEQAVVKKGGDVFGPGVTGLQADPVNKPGPGVTGIKPSDAAEGTKTEAPSLSIKELEAALEENHLLVDTFIEAEFARATGPRKGAVAALEAAENKRPDGAREKVLARLAAAVDPSSEG